MKFLRTQRFIVFFVMLLLPAYMFAGFFAGGGKAIRTANADTACTITPADLDKVTTAQTVSLAEELAARKALLMRTLSCAKNEARTLQTTLNGLTLSDDSKVLRTQLADRLNDAMNYYDLEIAKIDGAGISGTKTIAKEALAWRGANYAQLAAQVANFTFWGENQNLFTTASDRLGQMRNIVSFIVAAAPNSDLQNLLASAEALVQNANAQNRAAKDALLQSLSPDQSLALIQQSLQSLSDAYKKFFEVSKIVQVLLPAKQ